MDVCALPEEKRDVPEEEENDAATPTRARLEVLLGERAEARRRHAELHDLADTHFLHWLPTGDAMFTLGRQSKCVTAAR